MEGGAVSGYREIVERSVLRHVSRGTDLRNMPDRIRAHQRNAVDFSLQKGNAALFLDTGLGKSLCAFTYADNVASATGKPVLMLAPLGVTGQHYSEAGKFGFDDARIVRSGDEVKPGLNLCNYERLHLFNPGDFGGLILDESSVIKNFSGVTTRRLMEFGGHIPYRLACTATPAPNDHMELGQHCQFLGVMSSSEMLSRWFLADQSEMGRYRLKRHAVNSFWNWVASWARCAEKPSDLGGDDTGYNLPPLNLQRHIVKTDILSDAGDDEGQGRLFRIPSASATSIHREKRKTANDRAAKIVELVKAEPSEAWIIWVDTDYDADAVKALLPEATEVHGRMTQEQKEAGLADFSEGRARILITKGSIAGFGLNWQHCARVAFVGLSYSYEAFYQATRRCWRYGQTRPVDVHVACAETEEAIWQAISRKRDDHDTMKLAMRSAMSRAQEVRSVKLDYQPQKPAALPAWLESAA
jgi:superfamily II DNA or RNA helicase